MLSGEAGCARLVPAQVDDAIEGTSRETAAAAGWSREEEDWGRWVERLKRRRRARTLRWFRPGPVLEARNDKLARFAGGSAMVDDERARWVAAQRARRVEDRFRDLVVDMSDGDAACFMVVGDPGEADASQYAVVEPLLAMAKDSDFMVIVSDVVYPAGDVNDYVDAFYLPYEDYERPILGVPGNHDWYDLLSGFMFHFCDAEPLPATNYRRASYSWREQLARRHWLPAANPDRPLLEYHRRRRRVRSGGVWPPQPGPYFAVDAGPIRIVAIDTGITGTIDRERGGVAVSSLVRERQAEDPAHRKADLRRQRVPAGPDRVGSGPSRKVRDRRRGRSRPRQPLRRRNRRGRPQLPAVSGHAER